MSRYADRVRIEAEAQARRAAEEKEAMAHGILPRPTVVTAPLGQVAGEVAAKLSQTTGATVLILAKQGADMTLAAAQPNGQPMVEPDVRRALLQTLLHMVPPPGPALVSPGSHTGA